MEIPRVPSPAQAEVSLWLFFMESFVITPYLRLGLPVSRLVINSLINLHPVMHKFIIILPVQCRPRDPGLMVDYITGIALHDFSFFFPV